MSFSLNSNTLNTITLDGGTEGGGLVISFSQQVRAASTSTSTIISFAQNVKLLITYTSLTAINFEQSVQSEASGTVISFSQNVQLQNTFFSRNHYDCDIYIDNALVPKNQICSAVTIRKEEGVASQCRFSIIPPLGVQNAENYQGKSVFVNLTNSSGQVFRDFTGFVDTPSLDLIEKKISFDCTDRREAQILALPYTTVGKIGKYSNDVFGAPKDQADELSKRMSTIASSFDFDNYGTARVTPWEPKATADFTLADSSIYYDKPVVTYTNRTKTLNTINITVNYKHQRLHQQIANVTWSGYNDFLRDWFNVGSPSFPQRTTVQSAASATGWVPLSPIQFISLWAAGGYGSVQWQPNTVTNTYIARTQDIPVYYSNPVTHLPSLVWPDGFEHSYKSDVLDSRGQQIYDIASTTITDTSSGLCRGAQWIAGKKFAQTITELYTIKLTSPQGVSRFGAIESSEVININDPYNTSGWINNKAAYNAAVTSGTAANCTTNTASYVKGATSIHLAATGTGSFFIGDQITIDGDTSGFYYTVAQTLTSVSGGTLKIMQPGLGAALNAVNNTINLVPNSPTDSANFFIDEKPLYANLLLAIDVILQKSQTSLLRAHRDVSVNFKRSLWPEIDIVHTVATTATQVAAKGKVQTIEHMINVGSGEAYTTVSLQLSRSFGGDSQSVYKVQTPPYEDVSYIGLPTPVSLQTHFGINPSPSVTPVSLTWNGYIGNANVGSTQTGQTRTQYPESFIVDYPAISAMVTQDRVITQNPPGTNNGVTTDSAGYLAGVTSIVLHSGGTGQILQGDTVTIAGDSSNLTYVVQSDILDVSGGGVLLISPGLGANLNATQHAITSAGPSNQFIVAIPNDSLTVTF